jgi:hypothetical protein
VPAVWVAAVYLLTVATVVAPAAGLALAAGRVRWLVAAVHEEETELSVLGGRRPAGQDQPATEPDEDEVKQAEGHG